MTHRTALAWVALLAAPAIGAQQPRDAKAAVAALDKQGNEATIVRELNGVQGKPVETGGYYRPDAALTSAAMRPSSTLNGIIESIA